MSNNDNELLTWFEALPDDEKATVNTNILLRVGYLKMQLDEQDKDVEQSQDEDKKENESIHELFQRGYQELEKGEKQEEE